jgi:LCP family protein required for cell wall assembly
MPDTSDQPDQPAAPAPGLRRPTSRRRVALPVKLVGGVLSLALVVGGLTIGWAYLKFRAIPKIQVDHDVLGKAAPLTASTIAYEVLATDPGNPVPAGTEPPATTTEAAAAPTVPAAGATTTAVTAAVSTTTAPPATEISADAAAALADADAQDQADVSPTIGKKTTTKKAVVVYDTVAPGPIVDLNGVEPFGGSGAQNYLMIGVDSRADVPDGQDVAFGVGKVGGSRTDTIIVLRIDADSHKAWILSIPRDLYVPISGGSYDRINAAFERSADTLVKTIQDRLAIPIDHVAMVNFAGFQKIVDTVGGVEICFKYPTRDKLSGLNKPEAGCYTMNGQSSTAYVRSRHYQQFIDGVWKEDPRSDLGRIVRQQAFIRLVLSKAKSEATNPLKLNAMLDDLRTAIAIDSSFTFPETTSLANDLRSFDPETLEAFTVPTKGARIKGKAVLLLDQTKGRAILGKFRGE